MNRDVNTGVFFHCPDGFFKNPLSFAELQDYTKYCPGVTGSWSSDDFTWDEASIVHRIREHDLTRIVLAGPLPGTMKSLFSKAMALAGRDPREVILATFNDYGICRTNDIRTAKALVACAIPKLPFESIALP